MSAENVALLRHLLELGVDPRADERLEWRALYFAVREGNLEILRLLLDHGFDPKNGYRGETVLKYAKQEDLRRALEKAGAR